MDQNERPQYYEGQYLGAEDLAAIVRFARNGQARHALGAHKRSEATAIAPKSRFKTRLRRP